MNLDDLAYNLHEVAVEKGFWEPCGESDDFIFYAKQMCMIHSEVSEAMEALRKDQGNEKFVEELADIIIRTLDLYWGLKEDGYTDISLHDTYLEKTTYNEQRARMHGVLA